MSTIGNTSYNPFEGVKGFRDRLNPITDPVTKSEVMNPGEQIDQSQFGVTDRVNIGGPDNPCYPPGTLPGSLKYNKKSVDPWTPGQVLGQGTVSAGGGKKATDPWTFTQLFGPGTVRADSGTKATDPWTPGQLGIK